MTDIEMIRAVEANVPGAEHMVNFWVAREVLQKNPEILGPPQMLEWGVPDTQEPTYEQIAQWVAALPPLPAPIPQSVTRRQGRLALLDVGLLDAVEHAIGVIEDPAQKRAAQIEYEADTWERGNSFLQSMWARLGGTETELDALFINASEK